jgi:hypothetical protein
VVAVGKDGQRHAVPMRWGLVPWWAKDIIIPRWGVQVPLPLPIISKAFMNLPNALAPAFAAATAWGRCRSADYSICAAANGAISNPSISEMVWESAVGEYGLETNTPSFGRRQS